MKDESHHLKHVQKRILRSARRQSATNNKRLAVEEKSYSNKRSPHIEVYDDVVPSDQRVPRVPNRHYYY